MNFMKLYIGDYQRDTGTLSMAEHGAYMLMLQHYYATEQPLPVGRDLYRLLRAETRLERASVDEVVRRFWNATERGLTNARADEEIEKAQHQRAVNQAQGKRGGRPKLTDSVIESKTDSHTERKANNNPIHSHSQIPDLDLSPSGDMSGSSPDGAKPKRQNGNTHYRTDAIAVLQFLNEKAGRNYQATEPNLSLIVGRLKEGATVQQCRQVIAKKTREWSIKPDMAEYLRPATLFNRTKFAQYVGELVPVPAAHDERGGMFDGLS